MPFSGNDLNNGGIYACYDSGMLDNAADCLCVPNTMNACPVSTSIPKNAQNFGTCMLGKFAYANGPIYGSTCP